MQYDSVWDKLHEECGVFGIYDKEADIPRYVYWGLLPYSIADRKAAVLL